MKFVYEVVDTGVDGMAHQTVAFFESEIIADEVRAKETSYGKGSIRIHAVCESSESYEQFKKDVAIKKAKSKLTPEEIKLLGL